MRYVQRVSRIRYVAREYWFELLIAFLAIAGMLELVGRTRLAGRAAHDALDRDTYGGASSYCSLFARRRFPFAAPAAYWLLAAAISFGDGVLLAFIGSLGVVGLASAFLLGNLRNPLKAGAGLIIVLVGIVIVVYNIPGEQPTSDLVFIPLRFVVAWVAGYALRERAEQAEAAEERAAQAEREREAAARVAVAEERARIARELHDIVAHAVSVMVLQVGAVRHKLPDALAEDRDALRGVERAGRTALAEMRRLLAAMRREGDEAELVPQPGLDGLDSLLDEIGRAGLPVELHVDGEAVPASARDRPLRVSHRSGGPDERAQARARQRRGRDRSLSAGRAARSRCVTTAAAARRATASVTGSSASGNASRSTAAR